MAKRKVFGRLQRGHEGAVYTIEMREDGIWVRRLYGKALYQIPFSHLLNLAEKQMKLDIYEHLATNEQIKAMPSLPEGQLVHNEPGIEAGDLHAGDQPQDETVSGRTDGVDTSTGPVDETTGTQGGTDAPTDNQLPSSNGAVG